MSRLLGLPIVFLNGPPGAGKDTAADAIVAKVRGAVAMKFAEPLKRTTHEIYGLEGYPHGAFERGKEEPNPLFFGKSPRDAYIEVSERMVKPVKGADFYGRVFVNRASRLVVSSARRIELIAIADSGFVEEAIPVVAATGAENCLVVRIHASKRDKSFAGDSRGYLLDADLPGVKFFDVTNDSDPHSFSRDIAKRVQRWMDDREQARLARRPAGGRVPLARPDVSLANIIDTDSDEGSRLGGPSRGYAGCTTTDGASKNMPDRQRGA